MNKTNTVELADVPFEIPMCWNDQYIQRNLLGCLSLFDDEDVGILYSVRRTNNVHAVAHYLNDEPLAKRAKAIGEYLDFLNQASLELRVADVDLVSDLAFTCRQLIKNNKDLIPSALVAPICELL